MTVTVSATVASCIEMSSAVFRAMSTRTASTLSVWKPGKLRPDGVVARRQIDESVQPGVARTSSPGP